MYEVFLGEAIKRRRLELGLTQEQLSEGICEPITISRLENGRQTPSRCRLNALLERLDMPADRYYALLSKKELDIEALQREIIAYNIQYEKASGEEKNRVREKALNTHRELEAIIDIDDTVSRQLILRSRVIVGSSNGAYNLIEKKRMLTEAIRLTAPRFDLDDIGSGLYTTDEIKIINQLALVYANAGEHIEAIGIYTQLCKYIKKHFRNIPLTRANLNIIMYNYARELSSIGQFHKALETAEEGIKICLDYGHYHALPGLLAIQANCYHNIKDDKACRDYYIQAYYLMKVTGDNFNLEILRRKAKQDIALLFDD